MAAVCIDSNSAAPLLVVGTGALVILLIDLFRFPLDLKKHPNVRLFFSVLVCVAGIVASWRFVCGEGVPGTEMLFVDHYTTAFNIIILLGTALSLIMGHQQLSAQRVENTVDVDVLILLASLGGMVMVASANLILLFIGFELLSIIVYALSGMCRTSKASSEAALKYFIMGAFTSAFMLYGMALVYACTGTMSLMEISEFQAANIPILILGLGLIIFGFGFKVSLVPFHFWTPDVYQGAPVSLTGYMAVVVKAAAFGAFLRLLFVGFGNVSGSWVGLLWALSVVTMTVGNLVALRQKSTKRLLAYSSIAHAGYALIGLLVTNGGPEATIFYLLVYSLMTVVAFGVVLVVTRDTDAQYENDELESLRGLGWRNPLLGIVMTIAMFSLAGMPPFGGFVGKFYLFNAAIHGGFVGLVIIAALNSLVSLYYYLRVVVVMYFGDSKETSLLSSISMPAASVFALCLAALGIVYFGLFSNSAFEFARLAAQSLG